MRDTLGNKMEKGSLVYWRSQGFICNVVDIQEPSALAPVNSGEPEYRLTISIKLPVPKELTSRLRKDEEPMLPDFICVVNPIAQEFVEGALRGMKKQ